MPFPVRSAACAAAFCALLVGPARADTLLERDGIVMIEAESEPAVGGWRTERSVGGYRGSGYLVWTGSDAFAVSSAGRGTITYRFRIERAGDYELRWRSRITRGNNSTEHNDSWVRFPSGRNVSGEQALSGWTKVFMNQLNRWVWRSGTVDNVGRPVRQYFSAGDHTVQISGRSSGHAIDRIALFRYGDVSFSESRFDALAQSPSAERDAVPDPEPGRDQADDEGTSAPSPEPAGPVEVTAVVRTEAPALSVSGDTLSWPSVEARALNVHRGTGEWIESLPGERTDWRAPGPGSYYVVATGEGSWESWGRSRTVTVSAPSVIVPTPDAANAPGLGLTAQVYSRSALELFWRDDGLAAVGYEIRRNDALLTIEDGRSFFDDELSEGTRYVYTVTAFDAAGTVVDEERIAVTTLGRATPEDSAFDGLPLTALAYSQSAAEVFWNDAPLDPSLLYRFEVFANGEPIGSTDGRSLFVEDLVAGTTYEFTVEAIAADGSVTLSNPVSIDTFAPDLQ